VKAPPAYYQNKPQNIEIALSMVESVSEISRVLIETKSAAAAERIAGAYEQLGNESAALTIINDMKLAGYTVKPVNPFINFTPAIGKRGFRSPYAPRIISMWKTFREDIINIFPAPEVSEPPQDIDSIINDIEKISQDDAYHSLSIEGYQVTDDLISRIRSGEWSTDNNTSDNNMRGALAAKGYSLAHDRVVKSIRAAFESTQPGAVFRNNLSDWYRDLFYPMIQAGVLKPADLIGYRRNPVYIKDAMHIPPPYDAVVDSMETFFQLLEDEEDGAVRAVLGHYFFVYIHPYMDGNGRLARFLMNLMLVTAGYPWTIIKVSERTEYMKALDIVAVHKDIKPLTELIIKEMKNR
jgi:predicted CoA-binding protein